MAPFHYFCRDLIAASRKGLGCGPAAPTTTAFPALCCLPAACLCCLHTRAAVCGVLPLGVSKQVNLGVGRVCCRMLWALYEGHLA